MTRQYLVGLFLVTALLVLSEGAGDVGMAAAQTLPPLTWPNLSLTRVAQDLAQPVHLADAGDGSGRLFIVEKRGTIRILQDGAILETPFLDITDRVNAACGECGLLSVAFPPDFAEAGYFFVYYNAVEDLAPPDLPGQDFDTTIARFHLSSDPDLADPDSETRILSQHQPYTNHNGGLILFGPDGHLYAGLGDGGSGGDPDNNAQNPNTLLGKMLRIAVGPSGPYTIPPDNPFTDLPDYRDEIWALGLRNPWRYSFDRERGDLWIADVGQNQYEEVNYQPADSTGGQNYGWNQMEGKHCYANQPCDPAAYTLPIAEYPHGGGDRSIVGGYVYHSLNPDQPPVYLYADTYSGRVRGLQRYAATWESTVLMQVDFQTVSFGEDAAGRLYLVDIGGSVYRLEETVAQPRATRHLPIIIQNPVADPIDARP